MIVKIIRKVRKLRITDPEKMTALADRAAVLAELPGRFARKEAGSQTPTVNMVFVSENKIRELNHTFLGQRRRTDVLAFNLEPDESPEVSAVTGDDDDKVTAEIYICPLMAALAAARFQTEPEQEVVLYMVHGLLHLAGYDDSGPEQRLSMRGKEAEIMKQLNLLFKIRHILEMRYPV